jgi:hypothetical protein
MDSGAVLGIDRAQTGALRWLVAFSNAEPVSIPNQVRDRLSAENALARIETVMATDKTWS